MSSNRKAVTIAGLSLGGLYLIEAVFATSILFAVWPILGGIFAAALASWNHGGALTPRLGASVAARAGVVGGLVLLIVGTPLTYFLLQKLNEEPGLFGATLNMGPIPSLLIMFGIYALFGIILAAAAGAITGLLRGRPSSPRS